MKHFTILACLFALASVASVACTPGSEKTAADTTSSTTTTTEQSQTPTPPPAPAAEETKKKMQDVAVIETNLGEIEIVFFPDKAPGHVKNFEDLAKKGFYDGTKFHRVIPGFMIQGGDPNSKSKDRSTHGMGGPGYNIKAEFNDVPHARGIVSMARSQSPDSAGSQFFIVVKDSNFLDKNYTVFGKVIKGMDIADKIVNLPKDAADNPLEANPAIIKSVKIVQKEA